MTKLNEATIAIDDKVSLVLGAFQTKEDVERLVATVTLTLRAAGGGDRYANELKHLASAKNAEPAVGRALVQALVAGSSLDEEMRRRVVDAISAAAME
jgi:hypothetical protein